jgi:alpha-mannosidase
MQLKWRQLRKAKYGASIASMCFWAVVATPGNAQDSSTTQQQMLQAFKPELREIVEKLGTLNDLRMTNWRYHAGDLPHGETVGLDDMSWQMVAPKSVAPASAVWYRQTFEVPRSIDGYNPAGSRIWFRFRVSSDEDVPEIIYVNGKRVALGADLEPIVLTDSAKPGERFQIAVKLLATGAPKTFDGASLRIDYPETRPNPEDFREEVITAQTLLPSLSKNIAADQLLIDKALEAVDLKALDGTTPTAQIRFDASIKKAATILSALKPMLQEVSFHETGNSHIDAAWLWPRTETVDVVHRTFGTAAQLLHEYPKYTYTQSAAQYNEWMADKYPDLNDEIKKDINQGRWELVGGMWVEPDLNLPSGEATVRSILLGKRYYQKEYGVDVHIGWNPDSFGYNWQLPQIYKKSGIDTFVTQKMAWNDTNRLPFKLFWWQSPDGSKVLTYFPHGYGNESLDPMRLASDLVIARKEAPGLPSIMDLYGVSDHGGGPTRAILDQGMHWSQPDKIIPPMDFGTAASYFNQVRRQIADTSKTWNYRSLAEGYTYPASPASNQITIPTWNDELYLEYHRGVFTTQAKHKKNMREGEVEAIDAEKLASLAWLDTKQYPNTELTDAWEKIAFNGFHDLAAGSGIAVIYRDAQKDFDTVRRETDEISDASMSTLAAHINTSDGNGVPILVWNPLAWTRSALIPVKVQMPQSVDSVSVVGAGGRVLPSSIVSRNSATHTFDLLVDAENIPALGYATLHVLDGKKEFASDLKAQGLTLENTDIRLTVDKNTGCITSLYDKRSHFETLAHGACGNELQAYHDEPKEYDAWNIDPGTYDMPAIRIDNVESVDLLGNTPVLDTIRIKRKWQNSTFVQDISLSVDADHAVIQTTVDWHEKHILLKAAFPLAATSTEATYEIPYGSIERATTRNNSFEKARFEVPALKWADEGDGQHGFSLINSSKYGYDAVGNLLRLTLLRSPVSPDPHADQGLQTFSYALYPHAGTWKEASTVQHGYDFNYPMTATQVQAHQGELPADYSYVSVSSPSVILTAMKKAEDSNSLIFRMYESSGREQHIAVDLPPGAISAQMTNLMESESEGKIDLNNGTASVIIHPYEILTLKVNYTP